MERANDAGKRMILLTRLKTMEMKNPESALAVALRTLRRSKAEKNGDDKMMKKFIKYQSHAQVLNAHPNFNWDAVIDSDKNRRKVAKKKWRIPIVVDSLSKLPIDYDPDVVVLTTPPEERLDFLKKINKKKRDYS